LAPANLFLASPAELKFQSQQRSRGQSGDVRQPLRHPGDLRGARICRGGRTDNCGTAWPMHIVKSACMPAAY